MTAGPLSPMDCALFLFAAFSAAGCAQAAWLSSRSSRRVAWPIDGRRTFRGRRVFGDNKTARGFVVMVPAAGAAFFLLSLLVRHHATGLWPLTPGQYAALGAAAGAGFMLGELPNSFVKRQLGIAPGAPASGSLAAALGFAVDRLDSAIGMLLALGAIVPVPAETVVVVLLAGPIIHGGFSVLTFRLGGKARAA